MVGVAIRDWATRSVVPPPSWRAAFCLSEISVPLGCSGPGRIMRGVYQGKFCKPGSLPTPDPRPVRTVFGGAVFNGGHDRGHGARLGSGRCDSWFGLGRFDGRRLDCRLARSTRHGKSGLRESLPRGSRLLFARCSCICIVRSTSPAVRRLRCFLSFPLPIRTHGAG